MNRHSTERALAASTGTAELRTTADAVAAVESFSAAAPLPCTNLQRISYSNSSSLVLLGLCCITPLFCTASTCRRFQIQPISYCTTQRKQEFNSLRRFQYSSHQMLSKLHARDHGSCDHELWADGTTARMPRFRIISLPLLLLLIVALPTTFALSSRALYGCCVAVFCIILLPSSIYCSGQNMSRCGQLAHSFCLSFYLSVSSLFSPLILSRVSSLFPSIFSYLSPSSPFLPSLPFFVSLTVFAFFNFSLFFSRYRILHHPACAVTYSFIIFCEPAPCISFRFFRCRLGRQGLEFGTALTPADCMAGHYCAAGSLNIRGGMGFAGAEFIL